ncbi:MAG: hypothetical protein HY720_28580, partial [Planctomycetes bacterium]|nr:hypothetical protein [Planctomycetota bacterium]
SVKLDAATQETFQRVNRPVPGVTLAGVLRDMKTFRDSFAGEFELQVMIFPPNRKEIEGIARLAAGIAPDRIHLNTPRRPYPDAWYLERRGSHGGVPYPARPVARVSTEEAAACARILRETAGVPVVAVYGE